MSSIILGFCLLLSSARAHSWQGKIVNGTDAQPGEFPYAVSYRYFDEHNCGGSIIGKRWILTAAHCIHSEFDNESSILYGTTDLQNGYNPPANSVKIKRSVRHPLYEEYGGHFNDIGLVELEKPLEFNHLVQPIALPPPLSASPAGSKATLVGWGYDKTNGNVAETLQAVDIWVYSEEACNRAHEGKFNPRVHVCAGVPEGGKGQCTGDSGGPLAVNGVQIGTVSWSDKPCTSKGSPGVFAKVSTYREWIFKVTGI